LLALVFKFPNRHAFRLNWDLDYLLYFLGEAHRAKRIGTGWLMILPPRCH